MRITLPDSHCEQTQIQHANGRRQLRVSMAVVLTTVCALVGGGVIVASADAAPVNLCVPSAAGQAVVSNGSSTSCASGRTAVALPSSAADQATLIAVLPHLSFSSSGVDGKPTIRITGVNVQLEDGAGSTAAINGEGNLIIGYDQAPGPGGQSGSHNLVLGSGQAYTSYGSIIGGWDNFDGGRDSTVLGHDNAVTGAYASITGGSLGTASGSMSSVQGGYDNQASGAYGSVAGGCDNLAGTGTVASIPSACSAPNSFEEIAGGLGSQASANTATVAGGAVNLASGRESSVSGGDHNSASGEGSSITGGADNAASGSRTSVTGGESNFASGDGSSVTDGFGNAASGAHSSVSGGSENAATGAASSISGGEENSATDTGAFVAAGCDNLAGAGSPRDEGCDGGAGGDEAVLGGHQISLATTFGTYPAGP